MKLRRVIIQNVRSFLERQEITLTGDISILIGPNGGGKTNLLDTINLVLRHFLLKSWTPRHNPTEDWQERYDWIQNDAVKVSLLEKHSEGKTQQQIIELDIEVTQKDVDNINRSKSELSDFQQRIKSKYTNFQSYPEQSWNTEGLTAGKVIRFQIVNGSLKNGNAAQNTFCQYLNTYEMYSRIREEFEQSPLSMPMISLPVNRSAGNVSTSVSLSTFTEYEIKRTVDAASSRLPSSIISLAIGRLATRYRELLERDDGQAKIDFKKDSTITSFTEILKSLGYDWDLTCINPLKNQYDIQLSKQESSFNAGAASSGERELLTYLFAIYVLNVREALIIIDEPELHLHPRWQRILLSLFEQLAKETGNQFVMATHSPVFVSPNTIQYVSRVYSEKQQSKVVFLGDHDLPNLKHLFGIINSQNNERLFFADLVILVEGISDRIFFEELLRHFKIGEGSGKVYEIVSVGGKMLFSQYEKILNASHVPYAIIADLDYIKEIGDEKIKSLLTISDKSVKQNVVDDPTSIDGRTLISKLDEAISTGNTIILKPICEYIKSRHTRLRPDLSATEQEVLKTFIIEQRKKMCFILSKGALEDYLPDGYKGKDIEKIIQLTRAPVLWDHLPVDTKSELQEIITSIKL